MPRLSKLPQTRDPMIIRAEFLKSFNTALLSVGLLDRFQIAGALVTWWDGKEQSDEFKTIAALGFDELLDGWVDTIRDVIEDAESKKEDRDAAREHKLIRRLLPGYLRELDDADTDVTRMEAEKDEFERGPEGDEEGGDSENVEDAEKQNYAKELKDEIKELRNSIAEKLDRIKTLKASRKEPESIAALEHAKKESSMLRAELARLEKDTAPVLTDMDAIKARLVPYEEICEKLKVERKKLRELEQALVKRLESARASLTPEQARDLALDLAREALARVVAAGVMAHLRLVTAAVENLWDKYRVELTKREQTRAELAERLGKGLKGLGYV